MVLASNINDTVYTTQIIQGKTYGFKVSARNFVGLSEPSLQT